MTLQKYIITILFHVIQAATIEANGVPLSEAFANMLSTLPDITAIILEDKVCTADALPFRCLNMLSLIALLHAHTMYITACY